MNEATTTLTRAAREAIHFDDHIQRGDLQIGFPSIYSFTPRDG